MIVAITYEDEMVGQHFGRTEFFKLYDVENNEIKDQRVVSTNGEGHGALAGILEGLDVEVLICGGIGMGARAALEQAGIRLYPGTEGPCDEVMNAYLSGSLEYDPDKTCDHHDHEHECHSDDGCCH